MGFSRFLTPDGLAELLLTLPAVLWALSFHEFCHGWAAFQLGDRTAAAQGRLSLNPLAHLDPVGTLMLIFFHFGWAKPVPISSRRFKNPRRDIALVSLAGPIGNYLTAFACGILIHIAPSFFLGHWAVRQFMMTLVGVNIGLGTFNLIPIPPLDGSKVLGMMLPASAMRAYFFLEQYGTIIILALFFTGVTPLIMRPVTGFLWQLFLFQF